jgi:Tripartite tricarboxylate transporter family receptor
LFDAFVTSVDHIRAGRLRALAVTTTKRLEALPDIPTVDEFVPGYEASNWNGLGVPRNTPANIIDKLNKEINAVLVDPKMKAQLADLAAELLPGSPPTSAAHRRRNREVGQGDPSSPYQGGVKPLGVGFGSDSATELRGRHGGTCFDCGRRQDVGRALDGAPQRPDAAADGSAPAPGQEPPTALQKRLGQGQTCSPDRDRLSIQQWEIANATAGVHRRTCCGRL